jgi:hypothetical protein
VDSESIKDSLAVAQQLSTVLTNGLYGNPRQCKRFLNSLSMRESMAKYKNIPIKRNVLAKIMMLEYFKSELFKKFVKLYDEDSLIKELEKIEEKGVASGESLTEWENDEWVDIWLKSSPALHDVKDLRPYFYLTRDALLNRIVSNVNKLSPHAIEILKWLKSGGDIQISNAIKSSDGINDYEAKEILSNLFNEALSDSAGDSNLFGAILKWGAVKKGLYGEIFSLLKKVPKDRIKLPLIPLLGEFGEKTNQKGKILDWLNSMKFDGNIKKAIEKLEN